MDNLTQDLTPPSIHGLSWRSLQPADVAAVTQLAAACLAVDGGLHLGATETYIHGYYLPAGQGASLGAFEDVGLLAACAAVQAAHTPESFLITSVGKVHPDYRRRGLGTFLLEWSMAEAHKLLEACSRDRPHVLRLTSESLTETAEELFEQHGFTCRFAEDVLRRDLRQPLPDVQLPPGIELAMWAPTLIDQFFAVYQAAFQERPGYPSWSQEKWIAWLETDEDDFRPQFSLLACRGDLPVGFIICADHWVTQMGVLPEWRKRGIGSALMTEALRGFQAAGCDHVLLDVNVNNFQARELYARLGFEGVGRRGCYERLLV